MTADELIAALARCGNRVKVLRDDNRRLWESRQRWKEKHAEKARENTTLRQRVKRLEGYRVRDRERIPLRRPSPWNLRRPSPWHNVHLSDRDLARILEMPPRD